MDSKRKGKISSVTARVPSSSANLGPGFDVHSIALQLPQLEVRVEVRPIGSRIIEIDGTYANEATSDPKLNAAGKALDNLLKRKNISSGYAVSIKAEIPPRKGLGLSGAESVGAVFCANRLFDLKLKRNQVVELAAEAEPSHHVDNVLASAFGGFNIASRDPITSGVSFTTILPPNDLGVAVVVPMIEKKSTAATRQLIPDAVPKDAYVASLGYVSKISASFALRDVKSIIQALPWDSVVEAARADGGAYGDGVTAKFLHEEKQLLMKTYTVAETMSGAGPSRALWFSIREDAKAKRRNNVGLIDPAVDIVKERLESVGHRIHRVFFTKPAARGAIIKSEA